MKKRSLSRLAGLSALAAAIGLSACGKRAVGLEAATVTAEKTVYDAGSAGTSTPALMEASGRAGKPLPVVANKTPEPPKPPAAQTSSPSVVVPSAEIKGPKIAIRPLMPATLIQGTPLPESNRPPNLDTSQKEKLEEMVPEGVTLLSKGKKVTTSDPDPYGDLTIITDDEKKGDDGFYVDLLPNKQWIQIDLGESKEIYLLWVWHFYKQAVIYKDVIVQVSDDPGFKSATTVFNNDFDNSYGLGAGKDQSWVETNHGRAMPVPGVKGRYVRLHSNGRDIDDTNHYIEVSVYGK